MQPPRASALHFWQFRNGLGNTGQGLFGIATGGRNQVGRHAFFVIQQGFQQVFRGQPLVIFPHGNCLRGLNKPARAFSEFFYVHRQ